MRQQRPTPPNEWLTRLLTQDEHDREFAKVLSLPAGAAEWDNWTQEQWQKWQDKYNPKPAPTLAPQNQTVNNNEQPD